MSGSTEREQGRWAIAIACLLSEPTITAAAGRAGIGESTLRRWLTKPAFLRLYRRARRELVERAVARLQLAMNKAVETLERHLDSPSSTPADQIRAAKTIIDQAVAGVTLIDMEARLAEVEDLLQPSDGDEPRSRCGRSAWAELPAKQNGATNHER